MPEPTQADVDRHADYLTAMSRPGGSLRAAGERATIANPAWFINGEARIGRRKLHAEILARFRAEKTTVQLERRAIILAGPPGAGKSTVLGQLVSGAGGNLGEWRVIDADHFKDVLLRQAIADGTYESWLIPPDVAVLQAGGERFYPRELAALVHDESSRLALEARRQAVEAGERIVLDTVLKDPKNAIAVGRMLEAAGYEMTVVEVEVSREQSRERIRSRWEHGYRSAERRDLGAELGARWVPSELPEQLFEVGAAHSRCLESARTLAETCGAVVRFQQYGPGSGEREFVLIESRVRDAPVGELRADRANVAASAADAVRLAILDSAGPRATSTAPSVERAPAPRGQPHDGERERC